MVMEQVRYFVQIYILFVLYLAKYSIRSNAYTLTGSSTNATTGFQFNLTCETSTAFPVLFKMNSKGVCTISEVYPNGTCQFSGTYVMSFDYTCYPSNTYKILIPGRNVTENLHKSNWTCGNPFGGTEAVYVLHVNVPVSFVTISSSGATVTNLINVIQGKEQTFMCTTNAGRPAAKLQWYLSTSNLTNSSTPQTDVCNTDCTDDKFIFSSKLMYVGNVNDDGKTLYCIAVNTGAAEDVRSANKTIVIIYGPTQINITPENASYTVTEEESVGPITCTADCKPNCTMTWTGPNLSAANTSILHLRNIDRDQAGNYQCSARNDVSNMASAIVSIVVKYGPRFVSISPVKESYTVVETGTIGPITCTADCKPNCTMTWRGPNIPDGTTSTLKLQNIERNQTGSYQCEAKNDISSVISVYINITVKYGPSQINITPENTSYTVIEKESVGPITCTADCKPNCTMTWKGSNLSAASTSILHLLNIDRNQAGNYQCLAINDVSNMTSAIVSIVVKYGPRLINIAPVKESYTVVEMGNVGPITCTADCKPNCTMTWSGPNPAGTTSTLNLQNIDRNQSGSYQCEARNDISSLMSVYINITVNYGPRLVKIEPSTSLYIKNESLESIGPIKCTADCKPNCRITWYGPGLPSSITDVLSLHQINRTQAGNYSCTAENSVSNHSSIVLQLVVNFVPTINYIDNNQELGENNTAVITCKVESNPLSNVMWMYGNELLHTDEKFNLSNNLQGTHILSILMIRQVSCLSMGIYRCVANNMLGETDRSTYVTVMCSPRIECLECLRPVIPIKDEEVLNITVPIIAFPKPTISWRFADNGSSINASGETLTNNNINKHSATFLKKNVTRKDFGFYRVYAYNGVGNTTDYLYSFEVIPRRQPNKPDNLTCKGRTSSVALSWQSEFNGGLDQIFTIYYKKIIPFWEIIDWVSFQNYSDPGQQKYITAEIQPLQPGASYIFIVHAVNVHNYSRSNYVFCNTSSEDSNGQNDSSALDGGLAGLGAAIFVLVIVGAVVYLVKTRRFHKQGKDTEHFKSANTDADSYNEDELRDNPMYVSSGPKTGNIQNVEYFVVNKDCVPKQPQDNNIGVDIYAISQKSKSANKKQSDKMTMKNARKETKNRHIEMGCVYENSEDIIAARRNGISQNTNTNSKQNDSYQPKTNKDGLVYADLDFRTASDGMHCVIRGLENRTNYADIDLSRKADPLPDTDSDEEQTSEVNPVNVED